MRKSIYIYIVLLSAWACKEKKFIFKDLSSYQVDTTSLKDNELVRIIYFSGGPDYNPGMKYYYHYVVVSDSTKDTVNVLCPLMVDVNEENLMKQFINNKSDSKITIDKLVELAQRSKNTGHVGPDDITKVVNNRKFPQMENNHYPTTIGIFAEPSAVK